jgi:DNA-binding transcriptional MerR regulator
MTGGDAEQVYSTQQAAQQLEVGAAMLRRYAQTLERLTGRDIPHTRRDGRRFSAEHITTFQKARALIDANTGLSVEAALRAILSGGETDVIPANVPSSKLDTTAPVNALRDAVTAPLVAELRELRQEVRELQQARELPPAAPEDNLEGIQKSLERLKHTRLVEPETAAQVAQLDKIEAAARDTAQTSKHGPVVRLALWLERRLQGNRG